MQITKPSGLGNTTAAFGVTWRKLAVGFVVYGSGIILWSTPLFKWNWLAMIGYYVLASILIGETPTRRSMFSNTYGVVFKKPMKMVVSEFATINTIGHGIREVEYLPEFGIYASRLVTGQYALVYVVTSTLNRWSSEDEYAEHAHKMKTMFNNMEGMEGLQIVMKEDSDTGMLQLKKHLESREMEFGEGDDDLKALSNHRRTLLHLAATSEIARSVQQYAIIKVKPKNVRRVVSALEKSARLMRPAQNPIDIILATMGFEGGTMLTQEDYEGKGKKRERSKIASENGRMRKRESDKKAEREKAKKRPAKKTKKGRRR